MFATILAICAALATIVAVVAPTATNEKTPISKPTSAGWLLILLALIVMIATVLKHIEDEKTETQRFSIMSSKADRLQAQLSVSRQQNLLLVGSERRFPRILSIQIPVNLKFLPDHYSDPRDILFPYWKVEAQKRYLGELKLHSSSKNFLLSILFEVGLDDLDFLIDFQNDSELLRSIARLLLPPSERSCILDNILSHISSELLAKVKERYHHFEQFGTIYDTSFTDDIQTALNAMAANAQFLDLDCYRRSNVDHFVLSINPDVLLYQDKRILNLLAIRKALEFPSRGISRRHDCGKSTVSLGGARGRSSSRDEGLPPKFKVKSVLCSLYSVKGTERGFLEITVVFDGKQAIADWFSDFSMGTGIAELVYGTIDKESVPTVHEMKSRWREVFLDSPAVVQLPINESGSVVLQYMATRSDISHVEDSAVGEDLKVSWNISSEFAVAQTRHSARVTEKLESLRFSKGEIDNLQQ